MDSIPFDNIKDGAIVRCAVIDGVQYLSICDLIMVMCEKDRNQAEQVWKQIKFKSKGTDIILKRGISPNILELWENGVFGDQV